MNRNGNQENIRLVIFAAALFVVFVAIPYWYASRAGVINTPLLELAKMQIKLFVPFSEEAGTAWEHISGLDPASLTWEKMSAVLSYTGKWIRWPLALFLILLGCAALSLGRVRKLVRRLNMESLLKHNAESFACLCPIVGRGKELLDPGSYDSGNWRIARSPLQFAAEHGLLVDDEGAAFPLDQVIRNGLGSAEAPAYGQARLDEVKTPAVLQKQLGPALGGVSSLSPQRKALAAAFLAYAGGDKKEAVGILDTLSASYAEKDGLPVCPVLEKGDFQARVDGLLEKHQGILSDKIMTRHSSHELVWFMALLNRARKKGVLASSQFLFLRPLDRPLWYALNQCGGRAAWAEGFAPWAQYAADDAAGLAIRELMRADIASLHQGARNANDAISLIQTADGALGVIDEKLIRMKELAEQASTGTYDSTQRLMIDSEFQAMGAEIERIARATDFNNIKLLDGSHSGQHNGSGLESTGAIKIHFGTSNDSAEDYYYLDINDATLKGLGLAGGIIDPGEAGPNDALWKAFPNGVRTRGNSGLILLGIIPAGTTNLSIHLNDEGVDDALQLFTKSGYHIAGTQVGDNGWFEAGIIIGGDVSRVLTTQNGFDPGATYSANPQGVGPLAFTPGVAGHTLSYNGMNIGYSGHGLPGYNASDPIQNQEWLTIDTVMEDLILFLPGGGQYDITATWSFMPGENSGGGSVRAISIKTQDEAQRALERINEAIIRKDKIRAYLGATQNRLENTVTNLQVQAENLQAAESRISDADVAAEMTALVRNQILSQAAVAMLAQANSMPRMALSLMS